MSLWSQHQGSTHNTNIMVSPTTSLSKFHPPTITSIMIPVLVVPPSNAHYKHKHQIAVHICKIFKNYSKLLFISATYSKIIQIAVHIWKSFKTFQKHHKNLLKRLISHTNSSMTATAKFVPSDLSSSKLACNMSLPCPHVYALNKLVSTPQTPCSRIPQSSRINRVDLLLCSNLPQLRLRVIWCVQYI